MKVRVDIFKCNDCVDDMSPPRSATEFLGWLSSLIDSVPSGFKDRVKISIESSRCFGDPCVMVGVYYYREQTDEEKAQLVIDRKSDQEEEAARRRDLYDKLRAEFSDGLG